MQKIGIVGLGLIGGSIARRLKSSGKYSVCTLDADISAMECALKEKAIDDFAKSENDLMIFSDCDIVFLCVPVSMIPKYISALSGVVSENCILTDVGSTKRSIVESLNKDVNFIGGHPMTGSEKSGYEFSSAGLFENAYYILTPSENIDCSQLERLKNIVLDLGGIPVVIDANEHDKVVSAISHVPHVIAAMLVNMVEKLDEDGTMHALAAGGFKDITRIASSSPEMWKSISMENSGEIKNMLEMCKEFLTRFQEMLDEHNESELFRFFSSAKKFRDTFEATNTKYLNTHEVYVDIIDKPGIIATIATMLSVNSINIKNIGIVNNREHTAGVLQISLDNQNAKNKAIQLLREMNYIVYSDES